jgi:ATP-binding cassette, subfamily B, bacterial CvaB/MchF/RaxB
VRQRRGNDCGLASLATVASHYGRTVDYTQWLDRVALDQDGIDLFTLSQLARQLGFSTQGVKARYSAMAWLRLPAIAHLRSRMTSGHFVVLQHWHPRRVVLIDPARGLRIVSRGAFERASEGHLLLMVPSEPTP